MKSEQECKKEVESDLPIRKKDGVEYVEFETDHQKERAMKELEINSEENNAAADYCMEKYEKYEKCEEKKKKTGKKVKTEKQIDDSKRKDTMKKARI